MSMSKGMKPGQEATGVAKAEVGSATEVYDGRKMTFAENVILTIKILAMFGLLGAAIWGLKLWKAAS